MSPKKLELRKGQQLQREIDQSTISKEFAFPQFEIQLSDFNV